MRVKKEYLDFLAEEIVDSLLVQGIIKEDERAIAKVIIEVTLDEYLNTN